MESVTIGAGADTTRIASEFAYIPLAEPSPLSSKEKDTTSSAEHCAPGPMANNTDEAIRLAGKLRDLTLAPIASSMVSKPEEPPVHRRPRSIDGLPRGLKAIAPCRRPRAHTLEGRQHRLPLPVSTGTYPPPPPTTATLPAILMTRPMQLQRRRLRACSAPSPPACSETAQQPPVMVVDSTDATSAQPFRSAKRRLALDVDIPASVLKRRGAISPLAIPALELAAKRARARTYSGDATPPFLSSPLVGVLPSDASCPSTDDEQEEEDARGTSIASSPSLVTDS
ncbi:hypothetical protein THASP1DRAFT_28502 [Thamnocephalis sphaerospora]|uniref:Uncharacterized protein n=1 Tax=Thamnocephalis sphaerospora TaxID=78915 RepID=A0A4P9XUQ3_9FUNG|nr:hypothetical protein THASP1DRAFT_28502 [Thamnocephalis sphaerospora]|eukprot:RKP09702.1 hypothetical protein THASP1DRAFT_28502 [Thamnocephalis sphaerospora]